jgi:hypothetical protein
MAVDWGSFLVPLLFEVLDSVSRTLWDEDGAPRRGCGGWCATKDIDTRRAIAKLYQKLI